MAKKGGKIFFFVNSIVLFLLLLNIAISQNNTTSTNSSQVSQQQNITQNKTTVDKAYECLEKELKDDCSGAITIQQLAFSIMATPKTDILRKCVDRLKAKEKTEGCFGDSSCTIKDTALAILALDHIKENTTKYENWLLSKNLSTTEVEWIFQHDSSNETTCTLKYDGNDYQFTAKNDKKLTGNFGSCFSPIYQNYWLRINEDCLNKEIKIGCNQKSSISFIYRTPGSSKINVLSNTKEIVQNSETSFKIDSKCFGIDSCNYEDNVWAVLALMRKGHNIKDNIPYIITTEENNRQYFSEVFSYILTNYDRIYGEKIMKMQTDEKYWEAENSYYGKYYDTALVLLAMGHLNQKQIVDAKNWVWYSQESNGCWNSKNIRDSAFLLWATQRKTSPQPNTSQPNTTNVITTTRCDQGPAGASCIRQAECLENAGRVLTSYDCSYSPISFSVCCNITPVLKSCSELNGKICSQNEICSGIEKNSTNGKCCLGECRQNIAPRSKPEEEDKCKLAGGTCRTKCGNDQEEISEDCSDSSKVCCVKKTSPSSTTKKNLLWLWILLGILIVLVIIGILMKDKIKVMLYKKSNKDSGQKPIFGSGIRPAKPGFPPISGPPRPMVPARPLLGVPPRTAPGVENRPQPPIAARPQQRPAVFDKLKEISK
ncbi:MAG: proline-rich domain-containing protein [Candidatus Pacearchaeota archaeon]